jgi:hypothetical protein
MRLALVLASTSRAQDAGYLALRDVAAVAAELKAPYRIIGGQMVSLLVSVYDVAGPPARATLDADFGTTFDVIADPALAARLTEGGYAATGTANRFERNHDGLTLAIDVLAPSYTGRLETNQRHGDLVVDEIPGLAYALSRPAVEIELELRLTDDTPLRTTIAVPGPVAGLSLKALAYRSRYARSDAVDLWRLLEVAYAAGVRAADWPHTATPMEAARCLHRFFNTTPARGLPDISLDAHVQTRIRALVAAVVAPPR